MRSFETFGGRRRVQRAAAVEKSYAQEKAVRYVKAAFAVGTCNPKKAARKRQTCNAVEILFDSFAHARCEGVRLARNQTRQLLYRADPYQVDIPVEAIPHSNRLAVTGQLLDVSRPEIVGRDAQIMISNRLGDRVQLVTNEFGEFYAEIEDSGDLEVSLPMRLGKRTVIFLRNPLG